ncbi:U3 small nucleolar RNA-associated protein 14 homolog A isoform X1 [Polistes fuscatus]|uniref:U3 small nucleolar RNA-associated protein 14 homolog A isoform X1 n=1 Tax=Polistes fuscatus TaxID=30207 RepID=UPI001CA9B566|nr:U3 small nucleolar RNA-associated protein 14 homolog A isoform X1 [Polistes fuscatus]
MSGSDIDYDTDEEVSESHSKLLEAVAQLDKGQRVKKPERTEPTLEVSEFHLVKSGISDKNAVSVKNLVRSLGNKGYQTELSKKFNAVQKKTKVLPKPLEKPSADRIKRAVGFEKTQKEVSKWNGVISHNRVAEKVYFPLNKLSTKADSISKMVKRFTLQSDLEKKLAELKPIPEPEEIEEKEDKVAMTLEEIVERRKEAAHMRALQSYKEAKAHRQKRIKSKKFHRVQRKERIKQQIKEFEELQKSDPQTALEKLSLLDKSRAKERVTLRHKSTGQWAKNKQVRAKYDKETRQELAQQLSIGRELTQHLKVADDSSDNDDDDNDGDNENSMSFKLSDTTKENPWINEVKTENEIDEFINSYRKYWDAKNSESNKKDSNSDQVNNISQANNTERKQKQDNKTVSSNKELTIKANKLKKNEKSLITNKKVESEFNGTLDTNGSLKIKKVNKYNKVLKKVAATSAWDVQDCNESVTFDDMKNNSISPVEKIDDMFDLMEDKMRKQVRTRINRVKSKFNIDAEKENHNADESNVEESNIEELEFKNKSQKPILTNPLEEVAKSAKTSKNKDIMKLKELAKSLDKTTVDVSTNKDTNIDPNKYINVKPKHLKTDLPNVITGGDDVLDDSEGEEERNDVISEAFADDDVIDEFRKEKEEEIKKSQPEDIDLTLPGWGSWGGTNIKPSTRKKKQFIINVPKEEPRRDENKGDVIIIEDDHAKIREHQVNELPFPFSTVGDFEASIRAPIGRNFVPENAYKKFIEPSVQTALGKIIDPMDENVLVNKKINKKRKNDNENKSIIPINKKKK